MQNGFRLHIQREFQNLRWTSRILGGPIKTTTEFSLNRIENPPIRLDFKIKFECKRSTIILINWY